MKILAVLLVLASFAATVQAQTISGLCMVSAADDSLKHPDRDRADVMLRSNDCTDGERHCSSSENSDIAWSRLTGVSREMLKQENAQLDARMTGDAGDLNCSGTVHDGVLAGRYTFTPNAAFAQKMSSTGFDGITARKSQAFLILDISMAWVQGMKDAGVTELSTEKLISLRALGVDQNYIHRMAAAGYPELRASKLVEMKAVGVTPEKAVEAKAMGFQPDEHDLIQMSIFKIDRPFVDRMRARGMKDITLAQLIKIKIFKLDD